MNEVRNRFRLLIGFLIVSCTIFAQNQAADSNAAKASFTFDNNVFDYGDIPEDGGPAGHVFTIKNTGNEPLIVKQVVASCGCTTPDWTKNPIATGMTGEVKVAYNPKGRPGPFTKSISVYCNNADPVQLTIKGNVVSAKEGEEKVPVFTPIETLHDFGSIGESDGYASHTFKFKNTGTSPLTISRVQASCGCTRPEWTQTPVAPGQEGQIIITFNPQGRMGNFNKTATIYTNEDNGYKRHKLNIIGVVVDKPKENPYTTYVDTIGGVGIEEKNHTYKIFNVSGTNPKGMFVKNYNTEAVYFSCENLPEHMSLRYPDSLKGDWTAEMVLSIDGTKIAERRGRITDAFTWVIKDINGNVLGRDKITATVNYIDDFSNMSPLQSASAPSLEIKNAIIDLGEVKSGFMGVFGGSVSKQFILSNKGKSDLILHSVSSDDARIILPDLKGKVVKAGESLTVNATVKAKELGDESVDTNIHIICNDPKGPVRMIKVTAQKAK